MNKKNFVCIACPNSCKLTVWKDGGEINPNCWELLEHKVNNEKTAVRKPRQFFEFLKAFGIEFCQSI